VKKELDKALLYDPFAGDEFYGRILSDKIVKCRKEGVCHNCAEKIEKGQMIRSRCDVEDGEIMSFKWCQTCTEFMAQSDTDRGDDAFQARTQSKKGII
jgi:hypothetical protein